MGIDSYNPTVFQRLNNASKTRVLQLRESSLHRIPEEVEKLASLLRNFDISLNYLTVVPSWIGKFSQLKQLNLSRNSLESLPLEIGNVEKLETLIVSDNKLSTLPETLKQCFSLKTVDLSNNSFVEFPLVVSSNPELETVILANNRIEELPDILDIKAISIDLSKNRLRSIHGESIAKCPRLKLLNLDSNCLSTTEIESVVKQAPASLRITFLDNVSQMHTDDLMNMGNESSKSNPTTGVKKILNIGKPGPSSSVVNHHIENATKSRILQLKGSGIKSFPAEIEQIADILRNLDLSDNKIREIPSFVDRFTQLKQLHLANNRIEILPDEIGQLKKLETLNLAGNSISILPDTIAGCTDLKTIDLSSNAFEEFPKALFGLMQVNLVNLNGNKIEVIPDEIGELKAIELSLNRNRLRTINAEKLLTCPCLKTLRIEENCLQKTEFTEDFLKNSQISMIVLNGNLFQEREFQDLNGYEAYQERFTATRRKM